MCICQIALGFEWTGARHSLADRARADAWLQAEHASQRLVLALARDITRNITMYDLSLKGLQEALARPDLDQISPETRQMALFDRAAATEELGALLALDPNGDISADSTSSLSSVRNLADRDYFSVHKDRTDAGFSLAGPIEAGGGKEIPASRSAAA